MIKYLTLSSKQIFEKLNCILEQLRSSGGSKLQIKGSVVGLKILSPAFFEPSLLLNSSSMGA